MSSKVPKLRFDGFGGEWEEKRLEEQCFNISSGKTKALKNGKFNVFGSTGIIGKTETFTHNGNYILVARVGANAGLINYVTGKFAVTDNTLIIDLNKDKIMPQFLMYFLNIFNLNNLVFGSGQPLITGKQLKNLNLFLPKPNEQQKIANCLSSLDNLIESQNKKVKALEKHKKGLMQNLFPKDADKEPKLRFDGFSGEWEVKKLGEVVTYENGKAHEQDIQKIGKYLVVNSKFISTDGEIKKYTDTAFCLAKKDDVLMVLSDVPNGRAIAKCFLVDTNDLYTVNQRICKISSSKVISTLLFYMLNRNKYFLDFDDGVKQTNLKKDDVLSCPILLPKNNQEQNKTANCLSSLDKLIETQNKKIKTLEKHKQGLMQQLFVNSEH